MGPRRASARRTRRGFMVTGTDIERAVLALAFLGAATFGYIASSWMWQIEFAGGSVPGTTIVHSRVDFQLHQAPDLTQLFARERLGPPWTRDKYLRYFRPLAYGEASYARHGGERRAEAAAAAELERVYKRHAAASGEPPPGERGDLPEDDLWQELQYRGKHVQGAAEAGRAARLHAALAALEDKELAYGARVAAAATDGDGDGDGESLLGGFRSRAGFRALRDESRSIKNRLGSCAALESYSGRSMDPKRRMLFVLGAQKAGTTFLFNALTKHRAFVGADHAYGQGRGVWAKEVHFFNRWPLPHPPKREYLKCFPSFTWNVTEGPKATNFTLVDATPDYLFNSLAPPRIQAMWPHAKFVVLLRDPVMRAYSAWKMSKRMACKLQARTDAKVPCKFPEFAEMVISEVELLQKSRCTFARKGELFPKTWADCYRCKTSFVEQDACKGWLPVRKGPCSAGPFLTLSVSNYAAQLAWWFAHFPRSAFLFLTSAELHAASPVPVLNRVLDFVGLAGEQDPFQEYMMRNVWGYSGNYSVEDLDKLDLHALRFLRLYFRQADADLRALLAVSHDFEGVPADIDDAAIDAVLAEGPAGDAAA